MKLVDKWTELIAVQWTFDAERRGWSSDWQVRWATGLCVEVVESGDVCQQLVVDAQWHECQSQTTSGVFPATWCDHLQSSLYIPVHRLAPLKLPPVQIVNDRFPNLSRPNNWLPHQFKNFQFFFSHLAKPASLLFRLSPFEQVMSVMSG